MKKEEYLGILREDPFFKAVLDKAPNADERRRIKAYTEDFMMKFYDVVNGLEAIKAASPETLQKAEAELREELLRSGSV